MSKYIDADELIKTLNREGVPFNEDVNHFILHAPAADVVEVVRCKDCRWGRKVCGNIECSADLNEPVEYHGYNWFCPNGERMVNENE